MFFTLIERFSTLYILSCPAVFGHFSPAPRKNRSCGKNPINQSSQSWLFLNQSINRKVYNESLRLIDWFNPLSEKLPQGDDFRVGPESDRTPRDNTALPCYFNQFFFQKYFFKVLFLLWLYCPIFLKKKIFCIFRSIFSTHCRNCFSLPTFTSPFPFLRAIALSSIFQSTFPKQFILLLFKLSN